MQDYGTHNNFYKPQIIPINDTLHFLYTQPHGSQLGPSQTQVPYMILFVF